VTLTIVPTAEDVAQTLAARVAETLRARPETVLGLPTGHTPVGAYVRLVQLCAAGEVDFSRASSFNLDEFVGIEATHPGSFRQFMNRHLFSGVNLDPSRIHFLNGAAEDLDAECRRYDEAIAGCGGIDLQILGIGANGHIGFNEPAGALTAESHRVRLKNSTRRDNAALFGSQLDAVPLEALTMGIGAILRAARIILVAMGERKAECVERVVHGPITTRLPASLLQVHRDVEILLDRDAASKLRTL
jgi:glucosamine-6-phosphate deaminase